MIKLSGELNSSFLSGEREYSVQVVVVVVVVFVVVK